MKVVESHDQVGMVNKSISLFQILETNDQQWFILQILKEHFFWCLEMKTL